ncbi:MAG: hypothetical protein KIT72_13290 [Polyangiaceae bacterium]|nr:hypothetical protein [Polyangiaceae bacterium]MCW5791386.1 hypothetical protein [Polyangiaceae bacterium]
MTLRSWGAALLLSSWVVGCGSDSDSGLPQGGVDGGPDAAGAGGSGGISGSGGAGGLAGAGGLTGGAGGSAGLGGSAGSSGSGGIAGSGGLGGTSGAGVAGSGGIGGGSGECGDGAVDLGEQCDGPNLAGHSCATVVGASATGNLSCSPTCTFDTSDCCSPSCAGKACGEDGCGGTCGSCPPQSLCENGSCSCVPDCTGRQCGSNGCGGSCGTCSFGTCSFGQCQCTPNCGGKQCGPNGCGGSCGTCSGGATCNAAGQCLLPGGCTPPTECPSTTPSTQDAQYCLPLGAYAACQYCPSSCGLPQYGYQCTASGGPPGLSGCVHVGGGGHCCPQAACVRATPWDSACVAAGLPPLSYTCHQDAAVPAGCQQRSGAYYCCPS